MTKKMEVETRNPDSLKLNKPFNFFSKTIIENDVPTESHPIDHLGVLTGKADQEVGEEVHGPGTLAVRFTLDLGYKDPKISLGYLETTLGQYPNEPSPHYVIYAQSPDRQKTWASLGRIEYQGESKIEPKVQTVIFGQWLPTDPDKESLAQFIARVEQTNRDEGIEGVFDKPLPVKKEELTQIQFNLTTPAQEAKSRKAA